MAETKNRTLVIAALEDKLPGEKDTSFSLLVIPAKDVQTANIEAVKILEKKGYSGVYVSLSNDYKSASSALESAGIKLNKIRFVDAVSRMYGTAPEETKDVSYVDSPMSRKELVDGISSAVSSFEDKKRFVLLDSLSTILMYNSMESTIDFGKTLRDVMEKEKVAMVVVFPYKDKVNMDIVKKLIKSESEIITVTEAGEKKAGQSEEEIIEATNEGQIESGHEPNKDTTP